MFGTSFLFLIVLGCCAEAATRHVPVEYATIQAALDALLEGDTVLVDTGLYEEALVAPPVAFTLRGNVEPDTGDYPRPIIDPSTLPDSRDLCCLRADSADMVIEDMEFRNRWPMYPPNWDTTGGIWFRYGEMTLRRCLFDSASHSMLSHSGAINISNCDFRHSNRWAIVTRGSVVASDCHFQSDSVRWAQVDGREGSRIERCHFSGSYGSQTTLYLVGNDIQVRECVFGPGTSRGWNRIYFGCENSVFENNIIEDWAVFGGMFHLRMSQPSNNIIRNNVMRNCITPLSEPQSSLVGFDLSTTRTCDTCAVDFAHNVIENCWGYHGVPGLKVGGGRHIALENRFTNISPVAAATSADAGGVEWTLRDNLFYGNALALADTVAHSDAIWNWWGDSTGPYHATLNPAGLGDAIRGNVEFTPWYADTNDIAAMPPPRRTLVPVTYSLSAFPNPFNSMATLKLDLPQNVRGRLVVYDGLGRIVNVLLDGNLAAGAHDLRFDANGLSSGTYFVRWESPVYTAMQKAILIR